MRRRPEGGEQCLKNKWFTSIRSGRSARSPVRGTTAGMRPSSRWWRWIRAIPLSTRRATPLTVRKDGQNESEDLTLAARNALLNMIEHLGTRGFDRQQAYALCSAAVDLRISQTVDVPNLLVSALLPLDIFM